MAALFDDETYFLDYKQLPRPTLDELIQIVPANQHLARHNFPMPETTGLKQFAVRNLLEELSGFDIVLIDCPPNLYLCSWNGNDCLRLCGDPSAARRFRHTRFANSSSSGRKRP